MVFCAAVVFIAINTLCFVALRMRYLSILYLHFIFKHLISI
ncbi:hypothetical protein HMPREF1573_00591 [Gardnerella vaginalis JCP7276]|nr:hypothetical protein HMPREF1573_00591 [Gardnerella vaginalis JCP7276]